MESAAQNVDLKIFAVYTVSVTGAERYLSSDSMQLEQLHESTERKTRETYKPLDDKDITT